MRKIIYKVFGFALLVVLITINVNSTMKPSFGGEEVQARTGDTIPCWSAYGAGEAGDRFVYCLTCKEKKGKERNTVGSCTTTNPGEGD